MRDDVGRDSSDYCIGRDDSVWRVYVSGYMSDAVVLIQ